MGGAGASFSRSSSDASNRSEAVPGDLGYLRRNINQLFQGYLKGGASGLSTPMGVLGSIYNNLYTPGTEDFLGARTALQESLSGQGLGTAINTAYEQMLPTVERNVSEGTAGLRASMGKLGGRFSTDFMNAARRLSENTYGDARREAVNAGSNFYNQRAQTAADLYRMITGEGARLNPFLAMLGYGTQFAPLGGFGESSSKSLSVSANAGVLK